MSDQEFLSQSPLVLFKVWFEEAQRSSGMREPKAMTLSTLSPNGQVHARVVLLKEFTDQGLVFFSNYLSPKGEDLVHNPQCEVVFYWDLLQKQIRVQGSVSKTPRQVSEAYWNSRPRESQRSQYISNQSSPCPDRETLEKAVLEVEEKFKGEPIPCPLHWGGFLIQPTRFEFWTGRPGRLHDRFEFNKSGETWTSNRLYP